VQTLREGVNVINVPDLTIVVLAFNEEENVERFLDDCLSFLDTIPGNHDVVCVDDGSADRTWELAQRAANRDDRVRIIRHERNLGMGAGLRTGYREARGDYVAAFAADGQVAPTELRRMLPLLDRATIVTTVYSKRPSEFYRAFLSWGLRFLMRVILGISFELEGIYLFPVTVARDQIGLDNIRSDSFFFSFELIARAMASGQTVVTTEIEPKPRETGRSKVANLRSIGRVARNLIDFRIRLLRGK